MSIPAPAVRRVSAPPILRQPFRPLFLCAALSASLGIFAWALFLHMGLLPASSLPPLAWHGHELLFGFAGALVAGFLLTAVAEWTKLATFKPASLVLLVAVWLAARVLFLLPAHVPYALTAFLDCAFFGLLLLMVARPILKSRNRRNYFVIALLSAFTLADVAFHLSVAGVIHVAERSVLYWMIDLFTVLMLSIGGRVIPFFTARRLSNASVHRYRWLDWSVNGGAAILVLLDIILPRSATLAAVSLAVALLVLLRGWLWQPWKTWREPMLWILHLGYLWLAAGLALRSAALLSSALPEITALHAITVGALGSLSIGMMTRVALGHSGRAMAAGPFMAAAFALVSVAAVLRLINTPGLLPVAGVLWALAFAIYFLRFLPVMLAPRLG
ncbi:MAG TPA: NnrS family protein [Gammaproteobacteria bacterium]|nr:NnrS family protein [Gammaproteobacteria bacterium]